MDESSFETFEEELGAPLQEVPPPKPLRQVCRPEMYAAQRRVREEPPSSQQVQPVPKALPREIPASRGMSSIRRALSIQNLSQIEAPWEGVTLNRCLFIAISILLISSGCQRLHEFVRGRRVACDEEELEEGLSVRHSGLRRHHHHSPPPEPESSLWDILFWWIADDDDDDEDDEESGLGRSKKGAREKGLRGVARRRPSERKLLREKEGRFKDRRGKRWKQWKLEKEEEEGEEEEEEEEEEIPKKKIQKKEKAQKGTKTQKKLQRRVE